MTFKTKIDPMQKKEMSDLILRKIPHKDIAERFGVSTVYVRKLSSSIRNGKIPLTVAMPEELKTPAVEKYEESDILNMTEETKTTTTQEVKAPEVTEKKEELDVNKDYCSKCYGSGKVTEITRQNQSCPVCGVLLAWQ